MKTANILIADDHELVRDGLRARIHSHPGWRVCAEANNGREAVELALRFQPDVAALDIGMAELNGIDAARQIRKACPQTAVLMLTMLDSDDLIRDALAAGARGFLLKSDAARLFPDAIKALLAHQPFFTGRVADLILAGYLDPGQNANGGAAPSSRLSTPEREIVQ